ncbi:MAG: TIGR00725 family protein [Methanocorpusculum sp.]|nr:TIGR00725 family protein [Methanocorpusculum sp.]
MSRRQIVSVLGDASLEKCSPKYAFAYSLGEALVSAGYRVMSGGLGGVMEAVFAGAHASPVYRDGDTIAVLPGNNPDEANEYADVAIATGLDHARNFIVANADAVVAVGGGAGTLSEVSYAWVMYRLVLAYRVPGAGAAEGMFCDWSAVLADKRLDDKIRYPEIADDKIFGVSSARETIAVLTEKLPMYMKRPALAGKRSR